MRRIIGLAFIATLAASGTALAVRQSSGAELLASFGKALNDSKSVSATYTVQTLGLAGGDSKQEFKVLLKKPNLARIETQSSVIVLDGKKVYTLNKGENTYFSRPETASDLHELLSTSDYSILLGFADPNAYAAPSARALGRRQMGGATVDQVQVTNPHSQTTYYLDSSNHTARTASSEYKAPGGTSATVILHTSIDLNAAVPDSAFTFSAPEGARELSLDDINADKWFTNLEEACTVAAASHKKVFIDFMADWCGPCHMLENACFHTDTFKKFAKNYVFCRINVDDQQALAQRYGASAIPLQVIADASGSILDKTVGYGGPDAFFAFMRKNAG